MRKIILVTSYGSSNNKSISHSIEAIEKEITKAFPEYEIRRAFTSQHIIDKLKKYDGLEIDNVEKALDRAVEEGITHLVIQPTHLMDGYEYRKLTNIFDGYMGKFEYAALGKPLLSEAADFDAVIKAITEKTAVYNNGETAICLIGHGRKEDSGDIWIKLQEKISSARYENYYIGTIKEKPALKDVVTALRKKGIYRRVVLMPLMVTAGNHVQNDIAGEKEDSWKSILEREGYEVVCILEGLGDIPAIWDIYIAHIKDSL